MSYNLPVPKEEICQKFKDYLKFYSITKKPERFLCLKEIMEFYDIKDIPQTLSELRRVLKERDEREENIKMIVRYLKPEYKNLIKLLKNYTEIVNYRRAV